MTYSHTLEAWRDAREMERWSIIGDDDQGREERRQIQRERMIEAQIQDAYEEVERINCCDMGVLK